MVVLSTDAAAAPGIVQSCLAMNRRDFLELYRYTDWADQRLAAALRALPAAAAARGFEGSFPTIRDLLAHVVAVDWVWLERFAGGSPSAAPEWFQSGDVHLLCDQHAEVAARRLAFLRGRSEASLDDPLSFRYFSGAAGSLALRDALFHVVNHATYHRGQLASMLRAVGAEPPATDFTEFVVESGA